jgi:alpha-beta hydrolase superfamily lysophospholipase
MSVPRPGPPSRWATAGEALAGLEALRLAAKTPSLWAAPSGDGGPVILTPGLGATDRSLLPLRRFLRDKRHDARSAGFGRIHLDVPALAELLIQLSATVAAERGRKVALVGWSLGGVLSRETARRRPDLVERVITFGTPVAGGPAHTAFGRRYTPAELERIDRIGRQRRAHPIEVPITAIWSRRDGVVAPRACIDDVSPDVENVEVSSTHLGMGIDPDVWLIVARRLAGSRGTAGTTKG